jgi:choline dehydrogenase-like flavoprotein
LESGPSDAGEDEILTLANAPGLIGSKFDYAYQGVSPDGTDSMRFSAGHVLGGSSSINGAISFAAQDYDLEQWQDAGGNRWGPDECRPFFERVLEQVKVEQEEERNPCSAAFVQACKDHGFSAVDPSSRSIEEGVAWVNLAKQGPRRRSSAESYLRGESGPPATLTVVTDCTARRLKVDGGKAVAVETDQGVFEAGREIIVCCGAVESPRLLLLSGIGPEPSLQKLGIPVVNDLAGVGQRLNDHPEVVVMYSGSRPTVLNKSQAAEAVLFAGTHPDRPGPGLEFHLFAFEMGFFYGMSSGNSGSRYMFTIAPSLNHPLSEGSVELRSADPTVAPIIDLQLLSDPEGVDRRMIMEGVRLARELARQPALRDWWDREISPGDDFSDDDEAALAEYVNQHVSTAYHLFGTCRMGEVVDEQLRVRGVEGLRVADASIFPEPISVNPGITCMMVGERCADLVVGSA